MKVVVVAQTEFEPYALEEAGYVPHYEIDQPEEMFEEVGGDGWDREMYKFTDEYEAWVMQLPRSADELAEAAGRLCYRSWSRPNPATAKTDGYLRNILSKQHFSVLEHASATFLISEVSRALTHELIRHRHFSYSQLSQRYVDHAGAEFVLPPVFDELNDFDRSELRSELANVAAQAEMSYRSIEEMLLARGFNKKEARGAARCVLPEATETSILVTGNHRAFREFLSKRLSPAADAEIRQLAHMMLAELRKIAPSSYQDFEGVL